ncbi:MAG: hypothetical protein Q7U51_10270 [Methanoregula sp.]|nr:hypothetical protein [Methanoregula sp.]
MRTDIQPLEGRRATFIATFSRRDNFRTKWGFRVKILLKHIKDVQSKPLFDHVSITDQSSLQQMSLLKEGDLIVFSAVVREYQRGYHGDDIDLRLKHPESVDYMLYDIRDIEKKNLDVRTKKIPLDLGFKKLMENKFISLGVA